VGADGIDANREGTDWTAHEVAVLVGSYFLMLAEERGGRDYNKSWHRRRVTAVIGRKPGSIERSCKMCLLSWTRSGYRGSRATSLFRTTRTRWGRRCGTARVGEDRPGQAEVCQPSHQL
jgi:hypothetical protein